LKTAQEKLSALGYDVGTPDGAAGRKTTAALRSFQQSRNIPQTGRLDAATNTELAKQ
jgi:peptidoglycan hydrolase-like protein with peptidoglycan-binding domain